MKRSALYWLRNHTKTFDEHWESAGLSGPFNPFPNYPYFEDVFRFLSQNPTISQTTSKVRIIAKSRDLMLTWACVGKLTHMAMTKPSKIIAFQSQNKDKAEALVHYAKVLWENQEPYLKYEFPLKSGMRMDDFPMDKFEFANGSKIFGIPEGGDQIRSFHPTVLLMDEAAFQPEGQGAYDTAYHACEYEILLSTVWPGWFQEICTN